jgi:hypothetical protein
MPVLTYHKIEVNIPKTYKPSLYFLGSTLRGAFGVGLKKVVCINPTRLCQGCPSANNCLYYDFYEQKNIAHKYRFSKGLGHENYSFQLYLFEDASTKLPYALSAIDEMIHHNGIGVKREKLAIESMMCNDQCIYKNNAFQNIQVSPRQFTPDTLESSAKIEFLTPLRIKKEGRLLTRKPGLVELIVSIHNRLNEIKGYSIVRLPFSPQAIEIGGDVHFEDLSRYSNRQQTKMQIGGLLGNLAFSSIDEKSYMMLKLGEVLGVGKQTVFGLGEIKIS